MSIKRILISCALASLMPGSALAQTDAEKAFAEFRRQAMGQYTHFRQRANDEYAAFMEQAWKEFRAAPAIPHPKDEKVKPVEYKEQGKQPEPRPVKIEGEPVPAPIIPPQPKPQEPIQEEEAAVADTVGFSFYGTRGKVRFPKTARLSLRVADKASVSQAWKRLSAITANTLYDCLQLRKELRLCDWAYLQMLKSLAHQCLADKNEATLLWAFLYGQSGYQVRLARHGDSLYLLAGSRHMIYERNYYVLVGGTFYPMDCEETSLEVCDLAYPGEQPLSLYVPQSQGLAYAPSEPRQIASLRYPDVVAEVRTNKNLMKFYDAYPASELNGNVMTRWEMLANTPMDPHVSETLYPALKAAIAGKDEKEAANRLLNWVQTGLVYEYDDKVWGGDRAFFAEETLHYPYCDCEDRAILYTRLVRDLLGLNAILVYYPGHLACAVEFKQEVKGDYISLDGHRYVITDPTYIGAPVGRTMLGMDNQAAKVILLK